MRVRLTYLLLLWAAVVAAAPGHHIDGGFRNLYVENHDKNVFAYLRMRWFGDEPFIDYRGREHLIPSRTLQPATLRGHSSGAPQPRVTWLGHATVLIQHRGINVLTDPIFSDRASPLPFAGPKRYTPTPIALAELPSIHYAVISHNHYDHLDKATVRALGSETTWLVPLGLRAWFLDQGIAAGSVIELDWWQSRRLPGVTITAMPSQHWSARGLLDKFETLWASWAMEFDGFRVWFAGDTGYSEPLFTEIGARLGQVDLALIPIGGYSPRSFMRLNHVNPEEAVRIHRDVRARYSIGIHWGTYYLTGEPIEEPPKRLAAALPAAGLRPASFEAWAIGESRLLPLRGEANQARKALRKTSTQSST